MMAERQIETAVQQLAESVLASEGMELVDLEYRKEGRRWVLRLFIDKEEGVTVEDCANISRQLGDLLDVKEIIPRAYVLEVSSPGLNRRIRKKEDFRRFAGRQVKLQLISPVEGGRKRLTGRLLGVEKEAVVVAAGESRYLIALDNISRANIIYDFEPPRAK